LGTLTDDDWYNIRQFIKFLQVFYDVTLKISGSMYSTSNLFFDILCSVHSCLTEYSERASRNSMQCKTEIKQYFLEDVETLSEKFNILMWWKVHLTKFSVLAEIARDILAIPITTVAFESAFSIGGRVIDPFRSSLAAKTVEALVCTQNWLGSSPISAHESYLSKVEDEESYKLVSGNSSKINFLIF
jgi:hypothetical protein